MDNNKILLEYIKKVITEKEAGGDPLLTMFGIDPLIHVGQIALGELGKIVSSLRAFGEVLTKGFIKTITPSFVYRVKFRYSQAWAKDKQRVDAIHKQFATAYELNDLQNYPDLLGIAFLLNPGAVIAAKIIPRAATTALGITNSLMGGSTRVQSWMSKIAQNSRTNMDTTSGNHGWGGGTGYMAGDYGDMTGAGGYYETKKLVYKLLLNEKQQQLNPFADPNFVKEFNSSAVVQKMRAEAEKALKELETDLKNGVNEIDQFNSLEQLSQFLQVNIMEMIERDHGVQQFLSNAKSEYERVAKEAKKDISEYWNDSASGLNKIVDNNQRSIAEKEAIDSIKDGYKAKYREDVGAMLDQQIAKEQSQQTLPEYIQRLQQIKNNLSSHTPQ
jgi:hypothetical protein